MTVSLAEIAPDGFSRVVEVIEPLRCGTGALNGRDGTDVRDNNLNNMKNQPIELVEAQSSLAFVEYDIRPDSGGPGQWRGGVGQALTVRGPLRRRDLARARHGPHALPLLGRRRRQARRAAARHFQSWPRRRARAGQNPRTARAQGDTVTC